MPEVSSPLVFISYARDDRPWVREFAAALRQAGVSSLFDEDALEPGSRWVEQIGEALRESRTLIVVVSERSVRSEWVSFEVGAAIADRKRIIPVLASPVDRQTIPGYLRHLKAVDEPSPVAAARRVAEVVSHAPAA
jgi:hypothetical protein